MGDPNLSIASVSFPLRQKAAKLDLTVTPALGGGVVYSQRLPNVRAEILSGVKNKPKGLLRFRMADVFGQSQKELLVHDDWVQIGNLVYERVRKHGIGNPDKG